MKYHAYVIDYFPRCVDNFLWLMLFPVSICAFVSCQYFCQKIAILSSTFIFIYFFLGGGNCTLTKLQLSCNVAVT